MTFSDRKSIPFLILLCFACTRVLSGQATLIYSFPAQNAGGGPSGGLIADANGNLYGATLYGNSRVFELSPVAGGGWSERTLRDFTFSDMANGYLPNGPLIFDGHGNLYGTTSAGGSHPDTGGTVFELSPASGGTWTETVLYSFGASPTDGFQPNGGLVFDAHGNLYGTTYRGGAVGNQYNSGTVFELTPGPHGWTETVLHSFAQTPTDGYHPLAGLAIDPAGNLYGTTTSGGLHSGGTVFQLLHQHTGAWAESILHHFNTGPSDGGYPEGTPTLDANGNLYGTTFDGGPSQEGTLFELSPSSGGAWTERLFDVYAYPGHGYDPRGPVTIDSSGNLYATADGGEMGGGIVFELTPEPNQGWGETVLAQFDPYGASVPEGALVFDSAGNLYGELGYGGPQNGGAVFQIAAASIANRRIATTTSLVVEPDTNLVAGQPLTVIATVAAVSGTSVPTGSVSFSDPMFPGRTYDAPLDSNGRATYQGVVPPAGTYSIVGTYLGSTTLFSSTSATITRPVY